MDFVGGGNDLRITAAAASPFSHLVDDRHTPRERELRVEGRTEVLKDELLDRLMLGFKEQRLIVLSVERSAALFRFRRETSPGINT
jgi:hypothetical protein